MSINVGSKIANFSSTTDEGTTFNLSEITSNYLVLYFYPKDDTPGCTKEACSFRDLWSDFKKLDATIIGISRDPQSSHQAFKDKYNLPLTLLSDESEALCKLFGVLKDKSMFGKTVKGLERSTFLLDKNKTVIAVWRDVTVDGHSDEIMSAINSHKQLH